MALRVECLSPTATPPTRGSDGAVGYDLYASEAVWVPARQRALVSTDLRVFLPPGCYGRVAPRSGLALKFGIETGAGVIDPDYRGPLKVLLFNHSDDSYHVNVSDRIAQLVLECVVTPPVQVVAETTVDDAAPPSTRGSAGFGSTGR